MVFLSVFGHAVTLTFNLLTSKPKQFIFVSRSINAHHRYHRNNMTDGRHKKEQRKGSWKTHRHTQRSNNSISLDTAVTVCDKRSKLSTV